MGILFENFEGDVDEIVGLELNGMKCMFDNESGEDQLFSTYFYANDRYISIYINDLYCGVYESEVDASLEDVEEDDCFSLRNYDDWVKGKTITKAAVQCEKTIITLTIDLSDGTSIIMDSDNDCNGTIERRIKG